MKFRDVMIGVVCVAIVVMFLIVVEQGLSKPIAQRSNFTEEIISVELSDGTILKPGDHGFKEALKRANTIEWVP